MFNKRETIFTTRSCGTLEEMCHDILVQASGERLLKIAFFCGASNDSEYLEILDTLRSAVDCFFPTDKPLVSYIAQKPGDSQLAAEAIYLTDTDASIEHYERYILLSDGTCREIITEGIVPHDISMTAFEQSMEIFSTIGDILRSNSFVPSDIYRQWNYIQHITAGNDGSQNYQEFNDARSIFYADADWSNGYPAATGIGTDAGGIMVELCATKGYNAPNKPIDNPLQIAAHSYSQKVLDGKVVEMLNEKTTPKFERARILGTKIFISGTAAIKGESSDMSNDTVEQASITMEIMNRLIVADNIPVANNGAQYELLRVYVKRERDIPATRSYMDEHYPAVPKHYLVADICRPELLIEIEGVAHI